MPLRQARGYDVNAASNQARTHITGPLITRQEFKEESDINFMLKRFGVAAKMPRPLTPPEWGDFTAVNDFEDAMHQLTEAQQNFMTLPAELRDRFDNDPHDFLEFVQDDQNYDEAAELGLVPRPEPQPQTAPEATQSPPTAHGGTPEPSGT